MGGEMRILDFANHQITTIFHSEERLQLLLSKRKIDLPLQKPKIYQQHGNLAFSEELVSTEKIHFVSGDMFKKLLAKYIEYYKKLPKEIISKKLAPQHRDLHKDNILWSNGNPKYFIDFEDIQDDWYLRDLVSLMMYEGGASNNWHLLDLFFAGEFDSHFKEICAIFGDKFSNNDCFNYLSKCIDDRYKNANLNNQPDLKLRINATLKRYKNRSTKNTPKYCAFSTADENYALYAGATLLSMQAVDPTLDIFVVGKQFSNSAKTTFSSNGINYIELSNKDIVSLNSDYVPASYYYVSMPEYFLQQGYDYSTYVDADILAVRDFHKGFPKTKAFAGSAMSGTTFQSILKDKIPTLRKHYKLKANLSDNRIHSGVLFFNNKICSEIKFKSEIANLSNQLAKIIDAPIRDNELFTIYQAIHGNNLFNELPESYNYIEDINSNNRHFIQKDIRLYHFTFRTPKPWNKMSKRRFIWLFGSPRRFAMAYRWKKYAKHFMSILSQLTSKTK